MNPRRLEGIIYVPADLSLLILVLMLVPMGHGFIQNPIASTGDTPAYSGYLETLFGNVQKPSIGVSLWSGYKTFPRYDVTGGDYFNYWTDDHGKILLAANEFQDSTMQARALNVLIQSSGVTSSLPGRMVNSSLYRDVPTGPLTNPAVDYYVTNRMIALANYSFVEGSEVYERAVSIAPVWDNKTATKVLPPDKGSSFVADIAPTEVWLGNDTSHLRRIRLGDRHPSRQTLTLIETIGSGGGIAQEHGNETIRRTLSLVDPLGQITGVRLIVDTTITRWRPYATISIYVVNGWSSNIVVANMTLAFASADHYMAYVPYFYWQELADGSITGPTLLYRGVNVTLWSGGSQPVSTLFSGFQTPEFAKGYKVTILSGPGLSGTFYTSGFGYSVQYVVNSGLVTVSPSGTSAAETFLMTPMEKTDWSSPTALLNQSDLALPEGWTLTMPGSWGLVLLSLTQYAQNTGDNQVLSRAKALWNFYYQDAASRLVPTWIPENPSHGPVEYYRSLYSHALSGLILDPANSTYLGWTENVTQIAIIEQQDKNQGSANYGGLPFGLEEDGWAYALLMKLFQVTGNRNYQTVAHQIRDAIKTSLGYTGETVSTWRSIPEGCIADLPSVYTANPDGSCSAVYSNHPQIIFRASEMLYGLMLGATYEGTDSAPLYDEPIALATVSNLWKMSVSQDSGKISVNVRYATDLTGQSNTETQADGMLALAIWKQRMFNYTVGEYVEKITGATLASLSYNTNSGDLTIRLTGLNSSPATVKIYSRDATPNVIFTVGSGSGSYDSNTKIYTITVTLNGSGSASFIVTKPNKPTGPDLAIIAVTTGGTLAVIVGIIIVNKKRVKKRDVGGWATQLSS